MVKNTIREHFYRVPAGCQRVPEYCNVVKYTKTYAFHTIFIGCRPGANGCRNIAMS